jgi:hypothetical protein
LSLNKPFTLQLTELFVIFVAHLRMNVFCGHVFIGIVIAPVFDYSSVVTGFCCIDSQICCLQTVLNVSTLSSVRIVRGSVNFWILMYIGYVALHVLHSLKCQH